jgi:ATP-dependent DNA helicase RecG
MIRLGAAVERDGLAVPTVAGLVALGHRPAQRLPGMRVWLHAGRGEWVEDSLPDLLANLARHDALRGFPPGMVKEMVLNAMVHRDWSPAARSLPVRVQVAGRRLEVANPGALGSADWPPNPRLRALVRHLGLARGQGKGLVRISDELGHRGWPEIEVLELDGEVSVAVERKGGPLLRPAPVTRAPVPVQPRPAPRTPTPPPPRAPAPTPAVARLAPRPAAARGTAMSTSREARPIPRPVPAPAPDAGTVRDAAVVALAREEGTLTSRGVQERLGWSRSSTRDTLARLVAAGTLERLASSSRSPNQSYRRHRSSSPTVGLCHGVARDIAAG